MQYGTKEGFARFLEKAENEAKFGQLTRLWAGEYVTRSRDNTILYIEHCTNIEWNGSDFYKGWIITYYNGRLAVDGAFLTLRAAKRYIERNENFNR